MRPSQGSCFKVLYESSKWLVPFIVDRKAKLQCEMWENHAKRVSLRSSYQRCSITKLVLKASHIHRKATLLESLFNRSLSWFLDHVVKSAWLKIKKSISKIMTLQPGQQTITYPCCPISHEVKTTRDWNLFSQ